MLKKSIKINGTGRLPKYNFGTTAASYGSSVLGYDESKKWSDYSKFEKASTIGIGAGNIAAAGSGVVGAYMSATDTNPDRFTKRDATANTLGSIGSSAASMASAGAAFGPWGAAAGLVGGAIYGAITADSQNKKMAREQSSNDLISEGNKGYAAISNVGSASASQYNKNIGIPGMNSGTDKFYSNKDGVVNAMLASEEAVVSNNGDVDIVPGEYNSANPDVVPSSLEDGSSVLPKDKMFRLPHGKSTPADIAKKVALIQRNSEKIMSDKSSSFIDKNTAMLNRKNSDQVIDTLRIYSKSIRDRNGIGENGSKKLVKAYVGLDDFNNLGRKLYDDNVTVRMNTDENRNVIPYLPREKSPSMLKTPSIVASVKPIDIKDIPPIRSRVNTDIKVKTNRNDNDSGFRFTSSSMSDFIKPVALGMAVGSSISQMNNATPEVIQPTQYSFTNTKYRSNLYNQLRDIQARENIARYNNRVSSFNAASGTGANAALQYNSNNAYSNIYDANYKALVGYDNANLAELNRIKNLNLSEAAKTRDINSRSRAAARNIKYAAIQDIAKTIYPHTYTGNN